MKRIAVFASGNGTNFEAIVQACEEGTINAEVVLMVCDKPKAYVNQRALNHNIPSFTFKPKAYESKASYEEEIKKKLDECQVDLICLAGYMRLLSEVLLQDYEGKIINIHPSLLPSFKGAHAIEQAFNYGVKVYGVSIHYVDLSMDGGKIIAQKAFSYEGNSIEEVEEKIHAIEHDLYIKTINRLLGEK